MRTKANALNDKVQGKLALIALQQTTYKPRLMSSRYRCLGAKRWSKVIVNIDIPPGRYA